MSRKLEVVLGFVCIFYIMVKKKRYDPGISIYSQICIYTQGNTNRFGVDRKSEGVAQVVKCLPSKLEAMSSNSSTRGRGDENVICGLDMWLKW
jgi:hypothetical protein